MEPKWNYTFQAQEFEVGDELQLRVMDKHAWPRKDVLIGTGSIRLSADVLSSDRRPVEQSAQLFKKHEGEKPEHTGNIQVSLNFTVRAAPEHQSTVDTKVEPSISIPHLQIPASGVKSSDFAEQQGQQAATSKWEEMSAASGSRRPPVVGDKGEPFGAPERRQEAVIHQYWDRKVQPQRSKPVLCTRGVQLLLQRWRCLRLLCVSGSCAAGVGAALAAATAAHLL